MSHFTALGLSADLKRGTPIAPVTVDSYWNILQLPDDGLATSYCSRSVRGSKARLPT